MKHFVNLLSTRRATGLSSLLLFFFLSLLSAVPALAQIPATVLSNTGDNKPDGGTPANANFRHTGTDAIDIGGKKLQVMTWDDGSGTVTLSWDIDNLGAGIDGSFTLPGNLSDPDVVVGERNGKLYANVVCIDNAAGSGGQTALFGYIWNGSDFTTPMFGPFLLGSNIHRHSYPNIDANSEGLTAIVWQQSKDSFTTVTVSSLDFPPYSFTQTITFGRSFLAGSTIDTGIIGKCYRYYNPMTFTTQTGSPVIDPPTGLFEQTLRPDVAISESKVDGKPAIVSTTFIRHFVDGLNDFSIVDSLDVKQTYYEVCRETGEKSSPILYQVASKEWSLPTHLHIRGAPRIASIPSLALPADVEVVLDMHNTGCFENTYEVRNYGKSNNAFRPGYTLVSLPNLSFTMPGCQGSTNLRRREASEPVVSYYPGERGAKGFYMATWTGFEYYKVASDPFGGYEKRDVWASSLRHGVPEYFFPGTTIANMYSAVNKQDAGDQHTPSVAGRHLDNGYTAHLFVDDNDGQLSFKQTNGTAGYTQLRPSGSTHTTNPVLLQAYPNPADGAVTVQLQLHKGETARQLTVVDQLGRTVDRMTLDNPSQEQQLTWKPAAQLPAGTYVLKLVTSERTANLTISRK